LNFIIPYGIYLKKIQISHIFTSVLEKECVIIGRIAGQYAKPRSNDGEMHNGEKIEIYRGDIINDYDPNGDRTANPNRILEAYYNSVTTMYVLYLN
jgi:3-deoxy-7-phosphoheptulonate synthase